MTVFFSPTDRKGKDNKDERLGKEDGFLDDTA